MKIKETASVSHEEIYERMEEIELRLLQAIWSLESAFVEVNRRQQDLEIQIHQLRTKVKSPLSSGPAQAE